MGGTKPIKTEFRLIAATNIDLEKAVKEGRFREDSTTGSTSSPSSCRRCASAPRTSRSSRSSFSSATTRGSGKRIQGITDSTMAMLKKYWWPGNIRELEKPDRAARGGQRQGIHLGRGPAARVSLRAARAAGAPAATACSRTPPTRSSETSFFERSKNAAGTSPARLSTLEFR